MWWVPEVIPECHDVSVSTEAGQTHGVTHRYHVGSQYKGWLSDVVDKEARLRGHQEYFGLPLGAHYSQMSLSAGVLGGWGWKIYQLAPPWSVRVLGGVEVSPDLVGALNVCSHAVQETKAQHRAFQHQDRSWGCLVESREGRGKAWSLKLTFLALQNIITSQEMQKWVLIKRNQSIYKSISIANTVCVTTRMSNSLHIHMMEPWITCYLVLGTKWSLLACTLKFYTTTQQQCLFYVFRVRVFLGTKSVTFQ